MNAPSEPHDDTPAAPAGLNRTALAIGAFFAVLIAFNVAFYVVALTHPVQLLPVPSAAAAQAVAPSAPR
ncbi:MAG: hypothetical protein H6744_06990 [Deltaproteobacteria bacterium]|nr:hypothetical protein [Deltaproteobacteria bacterium]MCB9786424.1 hypothetical protein [Deltaproteobacteria bacterium]